MTLVLSREAASAPPEAVPQSAEPSPVVEQPRWPWVLAALAFVQYTYVGWWLISVKHYIISDAAMRTITAQLTIFSRDPHLGAIGFYWMPLPALARIPALLVLQPFGKAIYAGAVTSAMFAALTVPVLVRIGRTLDAPRWLIASGVACFVLNPVVVFSAACGMSETAFAFGVSVALLGFVRWHRRQTTWNLVRLALGIGLAGLMRYEAWIIGGMLAVAASLYAPKDRRGPTFIVAVMPLLAVIQGWLVVSRMIMGDALYFFHVSKSTNPTPEGAQWVPKVFDLAHSAVYTFGVFFAFGPALVLVLVACLVDFRSWRGSLGIVGASFITTVWLAQQLAGHHTWAVPRFFFLTPMFAVAGVFFAQSLPGLRARHANGFVASAGVALLALGMVTAALYLSSPNRTWAEGESAIVRSLIGTAGADDGRTVTDSGSNRIFIGDLRPFLAFTRDVDGELAKGKKIAMDSLQGVPLLLTRHPKQWIVPEDRDFEQITSDPVGRFDYIAFISGAQPDRYTQTLRNIVGSHDGGTWKLLGDYGGRMELYKFVPTPVGAAP